MDGRSSAAWIETVFCGGPSLCHAAKEAKISMSAQVLYFHAARQSCLELEPINTSDHH